jgi:hypothetical protein
MLGIVFGTICLILMVKVIFGRRYYRRGYGYRHGGGYGRSWFLRRIFQRLETGPGQEKVVLGEIDALRETARSLRSELKATRADIAAIMREEQFDRAKVDTLFRKQDELLERLRTAAVGSFEKVHAAMDERQKRQLADWVERGFYMGGYGHGC